ncbi:MAG TPA: FGGY-family carbohydrate kinase, partial [Clostridia bacterium]|nr:FGGY-family carbohydrate kinase [Clostridia bacterium]
MALMGLDVGSTGCKAMVFTEDGKLLANAYREYDNDSAYRINAEIIWKSVCDVIKKCVSETHAKIKALSVSSFGESFVPVDINGNVLADTMLYTDNRGNVQCKRYQEQFGAEKMMAIAGAKPQPMFSLFKIGYIRDEQPDIFAKAHKFLLMGSFIIHRLTGEFAVDYSLAARTYAFDIINKKWSPELLGLAGMGEDKMAAAVPCGTIVSTILPDVAQELGLPADLKIVTGGHDQVCAATGAGITQPGYAIDGMGTVECITPVFDKPILTDVFLFNNYACVPYSIDGMYVTYAFNFTGGSILKWYRDNLARAEAQAAKEKNINVYKLLDESGAREPTGLTVLPLFAGSATPD